LLELGSNVVLKLMGDFTARGEKLTADYKGVQAAVLCRISCIPVCCLKNLEIRIYGIVI